MAEVRTLEDLAAHTGIARSTSRMLDRVPVAGTAQRTGLDTIGEARYRPRPGPRSLAPGRTDAIADAVNESASLLVDRYPR